MQAEVPASCLFGPDEKNLTVVNCGDDYKYCAVSMAFKILESNFQFFLNEFIFKSMERGRITVSYKLHNFLVA